MSIRADRNLQFLFAALFFWTFGVALYETLVPIYARQLGASPVQLGTLFTLRHLALAGGFLIGIAVADRLDRRTVMLAAWIGGMPVPLMLAAAPDYLWLLPGLLLYEVTFFGLPVVHAYVSERVPSSHLASTFGALGTTTSTAFLVGPTIGGLVADRWGIRATLLLAFAFYVLSTALVLPIERSGRPAGSPSTRLGWMDVRPLLPVLCIYVGLQLVVLFTWPFATPFLREARGLSLSEIGFLSSMQAVGGVVLTAIAGRLGDRWGVAPALAASLMVFGGGIALIVLAPAALLPVVSIFRARAPMNALGQAMIGAAAPAPLFGRAFALAGMLSALLAAAGVFVGGFAYRWSPASPMLISAGLAVIMAVAVLRSAPAARST